MELQPDLLEMLELMVSPVFLVKENQIIQTNEAASRLSLRAGIPVTSLLEAGAEDYSRFSGGLLYVTVSIYGQNWGATVARIQNVDVFTLDQQFESEELRVLMLAAQNLRGPLASIILAEQQLRTEETEDSQSRLHRQLTHGLNQLIRIIGNMSDASGKSHILHPEYRMIDSLFRECVGKAADFARACDISLSYSGLEKDIMCCVDWQMLERAALNVLSNAVKFSAPGSDVQVQLHHVGKMLCFSVTNHDNGASDALYGTLFRRYRRDPVIEDIRHGIGLGMLMIRNAASRHGGAVLIDHPAEGTIRVSFTFSKNLTAPPKLHTFPFSVDYAGELDHVLLELSDCLPSDIY